MHYSVPANTLATLWYIQKRSLTLRRDTVSPRESLAGDFIMHKRRVLRFGLVSLLLVALVPLVYLIYVYTQPQSQIVAALTSRDRNFVYVALETLSGDGVSVSEQIDINRPFAEGQPALADLVDEIGNLDDQLLESLDRAYAARLLIHSPLGPNTYWE